MCVFSSAALFYFHNSLLFDESSKNDASSKVANISSQYESVDGRTIS